MTKLCPLNIINNKNGMVLTYLEENCMFWEEKTCVMKSFFLGLTLGNDSLPSDKGVT